MLRRNRGPPLPHQRNTPENRIQEPALRARNALLSPPVMPNRLQRKPAEEPPAKSSSLGNKFKSRAFQEQQRDLVPAKTLFQRQQDYQVNNDYYPQSRPSRNKQPVFYSQHLTHNKEEVVEPFRSTPQLSSYDLDENKERDSMSTELSKQEQIQQKNFKEVKFGGVIEEDNHLFLKKRDKVRSPSILKNGRNMLNSSLVSREKERSCSVASRRDAEKPKNQTNVSQVIKQKYKSILAKLQVNIAGNHYPRSNRFSAVAYNTYNAATYNTEKSRIASPFKYKDDIFPPVHSSLFNSRKNQPKLGPDVTWKRVGELFGQRDLVLARPNQTDIEIYKTQDSYCEDYFPGALNCLLGCPSILERMFEDQTVNPFGIYLVKIYQESIWKYIIIDDYIPVMRGQNGNLQPAFINVKSQGSIDIWPFLVEKAYANYYSSYEALHYGNILDFAEELTGSPSQKIIIRSQSLKKGDKMTTEEVEKAILKVNKAMKNGNVVALGEISGDKGCAPLTYNASKGELHWYDPFLSFKRRKISFEQLQETFRAVFLISPLKTSNHSHVVLKRSRPTLKKKLSLYLYEPDYPSIRTFKVAEPGEYNVSVKQRDKRFFHFKDNYGDYIWVRAILLQKEYEDCGYRWIQGFYSQKKSINFINYLEEGQYLLLIEPEWQSNSPCELSIHISGPSECELKRQSFNEEDRIMQKGCLDLAQRHGELNQINKFICSYNYITEQVGLIIENIVNQRVVGNVSVIRSIRGLKCRSEIVPANYEFYEKITTMDGEHLLKLNEEIELDIPEGGHYTVVLKMKGGLDSKFFRTFDFGC